MIHCPFCHGFEVRDRRIVQIVTHPMGLHTAGLFRQLSAQLTVVLHDPTDVDDAELDALRASGVDIVDARVTRIVTGADGHVAAVELAGHDPIDADAVVVAPRFRVRAEPFESLGLRPARSPERAGRLRGDRRDAVRRTWRGSTPLATCPIRASRCWRPPPPAAGSGR